jgi:hypothetical protein
VAKAPGVDSASSITISRQVHQIWLMTLYDKDEASDLSAKQKKLLKDSLEMELAARTTRRGARN